MKKPALKYILGVVLIAPLPLSAEYLDITIFAGPNFGEYIEETGQKIPTNIQGISGGSRITYPRNFNNYGISLNWFLYDRFEISGSYKNTLKTAETGEGRDEDFLMDPTFSTARSSKISLSEGKFYDTAYTFTGIRNYADAKGRMRLSEYGANFFGRFYFSENAEEEGGVFISAGYSYSYSFYSFDNIVQYMNLPITGLQLYPIRGTALTLSMNSHEYLFGGGYRFQYEKWSLDFSFLPFLVYTDAHDSHHLRFMNFYIQTYGSGFLFDVKFNYRVTDTIFIGTEFFAHRAYQDGVVKARGGITNEDIFSNFAGGGRIYMNNKESGILLSMTKRILLE